MEVCSVWILGVGMSHEEEPALMGIEFKTSWPHVPQLRETMLPVYQ